MADIMSISNFCEKYLCSKARFMQLPWSGFYWFNSLRGAGSDAEMPPVSSCLNEAMRNGEEKKMIQFLQHRKQMHKVMQNSNLS